jgi:hypothetical protein
MGRIITPTTMAADKALKTSISGNISFNLGVIKVKANNPYTTVGIPAKISRIGFINDLNLFEENSERKTATKRPMGRAIRIEPKTTKKVPVTKGSTPKFRGSINGSHFVPNKKSKMDTWEKNSRQSLPKIKITVLLTSTVTETHANR